MGDSRYIKAWYLEQDAQRLPITFIAKRDAIDYANSNLWGQYVLIKEHELHGETRETREAEPFLGHA